MMEIRRRGAILIALAMLLIAAPSAFARPGDLDPSYGTGGIATIPLSDDSFDAFDVNTADFQPDGKVVATGYFRDRDIGCVDCPSLDTFYVSRLDPHGSLDTSFGDHGTVEGNFGISGYVNFTDALVDDSNRILIAGTTLTSTVVVRLDPDGSLDPTFGDGGLVRLAASSGEVNFVAHIAQQSSGKTIVEWVDADDHTNRDRSIDLVRLLPGGSRDMTFGTEGATSSATEDFQLIRSIEIDSEDRIVIGEGATEYSSRTESTRIRRYLADGAPDPNFGAGGKATIRSGPLGPSTPVLKVAIDGSDRIDAMDTSKRVVTRLLPEGTPDPDFGEGGTATIDGIAGSLGLQANGLLLVAGPDYSQPYALGIARHLTDGALDLDFGDGGATRTFLDRSLGDPVILVRPDGRILLVAGSGYGGAALVSAQYRVDSGPPDDADADGVVDPGDRCPGRYGPGDGCPHYIRAIRVHRKGKSKFVGKVKSSEHSCLGDWRVVLFRQAARGDRRLGSTHLSYSGFDDLAEFSYAADRNIRDRVYAVTSRRFDARRGICERVQSQPTRRILRR